MRSGYVAQQFGALAGNFFGEKVDTRDFGRLMLATWPPVTGAGAAPKAIGMGAAIAARNGV
jgi:hypothetical protein